MRKIGLLILLTFGSHCVYSQIAEKPITTGLPFLLINPDARAGGLGDQGVATSADGFSQYWNPAKYPFASSEQGVTASFTPYLSQIVSDINMSQLTYYNQLNEKSSFSGGFRYFSLGEVEFRKNINDVGVTRKPNELALDLAYSLKLSNSFAMAVTGRYINSNLKTVETDADASSANAFSVDISGFYESKEFALSTFIGKYRGGFNIQNIGPKVKYNADGAENNLPTNLKAGAGFDFILDQFNTVSITGEINKLLVPTPKDFNGDGVIDSKDGVEYNSIGWSSGIFKSFNDAPNGFSEEMREVVWSLGAEYWYQDAFALRAGYYHESETKGFRKYYTMGAGFKYNVLQIDLSYIFSTSKIPNPLEGTLRFSLTLNFGDKTKKSEE
jgi:hypothetical protein